MKNYLKAALALVVGLMAVQQVKAVLPLSENTKPLKESTSLLTEIVKTKKSLEENVEGKNNFEDYAKVLASATNVKDMNKIKVDSAKYPELAATMKKYTNFREIYYMWNFLRAVLLARDYITIAAAAHLMHDMAPIFERIIV